MVRYEVDKLLIIYLDAIRKQVTMSAYLSRRGVQDREVQLVLGGAQVREQVEEGGFDLPAPLLGCAGPVHLQGMTVGLGLGSGLASR